MDNQFVKNYPETKRSYSSFYRQDHNIGSMLDVHGYWRPETRDFVPGTEYVEVEVSDNIAGLLIQGRPYRPHYVSLIKVDYSLDGGNNYITLGNFKNSNLPRGNNKNIIIFDNGIVPNEITHLRLYPMEWVGIPALRFGLISNNVFDVTISTYGIEDAFSLKSLALNRQGSQPQPEPQLSTLLGDLNNDGIFTAADVVFLASYIAEIPEFVAQSAKDPLFTVKADLNKDGLVTAADVVYMASKIAEIPEFTVSGDVTEDQSEPNTLVVKPPRVPRGPRQP